MMQIIKESEINGIIVVAPHPDDELLACSSLITCAIKNNIECNIIILSNGEDDTLGLMYKVARDSMGKKGEMYFGGSIYFSKSTAGGIKSILFILLFDVDYNPLSYTELEVSFLSKVYSVKTNELGWCVLQLEGRAIFPKVKVCKKDSCSFYIRQVLSKELKELFSVQRRNESIKAITAMGVDMSCIKFLSFDDGYITENLKDKLFQKKLMDCISDCLTSRSLMIIPYENDYDCDHSGVSRFLQSIHFDEVTKVFQYLIHYHQNHEDWPYPEYNGKRNSRIKMESYMKLPSDINKYIQHSILLSDMGISVEEKMNLIENYRSQLNVDVTGFLFGFVRLNECFIEKDKI